MNKEGKDAGVPFCCLVFPLQQPAAVETVSPTLFSMQLFLIQNKYCFSPVSVAGQYQTSFQSSSHIPFLAGSLESLQHNKLLVLYASVMESLHVS